MTENEEKAPNSVEERPSPNLYYAFHTGSAKTYGPADSSLIISWIALGRLSTADQVCRQGDSSWTPLTKSGFAKHVLGVVDVEKSNAWEYLKRALKLIEAVSERSGVVYGQMVEFSRADDSDKPFLQAITSAVKTRRAITSEKASLVEDLRLASLELDKCEAIDPDATTEFTGASHNIASARAALLFEQGRMELMWGSHQVAKGRFQESLELVEISDTHFALGLIYEEEGNLGAAFDSYEQYLKLDPDGDDSIQALKNLERLRKRVPGR